MDSTIDVPSTPTLRIHKIHPQSQIIGKSTAGVQTRRKLKESTSDQHQALLSFIYKQNRTNHKDQQTCLFACFLSQEEPKKVSQALADEMGNKRDERGTIIKNKARLVAQGYRQEEGVDYDEVFAPVARIEAIRLFLAFASFMGFIVYQMDVKSAFLYGNTPEKCIQTATRFYADPWLIQTKSSMVKGFYEDLMQKEFTKMSSMGELTFFLGLQVKQSNGGIFLSQDKYVKDILNKFDFRTIKPASTPIEAHKSLGKDEDVKYSVTVPESSHLPAVKGFFRNDVPKSWKKTVSHCNAMKQNMWLSPLPEAEYVALPSCALQVLWMQNQLLDYGFNFMNTEIHIDNESTICIVKNPVFHSKTKHIQIRHHFIRDCYEQRLINVVKVSYGLQVADYSPKALDLARLNFLVVTIGMMNP
ncbi:retrovirus-related pol polyprotein from transposon TNT 1-94 [Tanacetum coccineum]